MEFVMLESRGGNYLVVAQNIAWLRTAENGQTSVGIVGGQPLLVVGSIEEVADKILSAASEAKTRGAEAAAATHSAAEATIKPSATSESTPALAPPAIVHEPAVDMALAAEASESPRLVPAKQMSLSDRLGLAAVPKVRAGN